MWKSRPGSGCRWKRASVYKGMAEELKESASAILVTFALALVIVFLVLAAQFESWIHPLIIMLTVPLALAGAVIAISVTGDSLNISARSA